MSTEDRLARIDDSLSRKQPTLQIMLDNVHSSQNLSAIIRSCDAVGVLDIYYSTKENESLRIHKTITQGAHRWTHRYRMNDAHKAAFLKQKKAQGFQVVVTHLEERAVSFREIDYTKPTLLVMGNEKEGVSPDTFFAIIEKYSPGAFPKKNGVNIEARKEAGFSCGEMKKILDGHEC